tara:strand:- start:36 stop:1520 length:1485 start_codon:yes stop_codon:yes gene_type:complete
MKEKILVWINSSLVYFGLCKSLQEKYDCELYAIYDITDKPKKYFQTQKIVKFQNSWFYYDLISKTNSGPDVQFLKQFEEKYDLNLWLLARNDRIFYTFNEFHDFTTDEILSILEQECRSFEKILDTVNPDYVIMFHPILRQDFLFYLICKAKGIKTLVLRTTRIGKKFIVSDNYSNIEFNKTSSTDTSFVHSTNLLDYHEKFDPYNVTKHFRSRFMSSKKDMIRALLRYFFSENTNPTTHYTYYGRSKTKVFLNYTKYSLQSKIRKSFIDKHLLKDINLATPFVYFPLHLEQESSTLIHAPFHTDELSIIKQIVKSLPVGLQLYVKEHPSMKVRRWRSISFYKELMSLPNVSVLHPSFNPNILLKNCSLVIVITGTAGFDAGFYQKPAIALVDNEYSSLGHVTVLKSISELPEIIKECLKKTITPDDMWSYIKFVEKNSFDIDMDSFQQDLQDVLNHGGFLVDVEINESQFHSFLNSKKKEFDLLATEHIKKFS